MSTRQSKFRWQSAGVIAALAAMYSEAKEPRLMNKQELTGHYQGEKGIQAHREARKKANKLARRQRRINRVRGN